MSAPSTTASPSRPVRDDLHWLAMRLFRGLGAIELAALRQHSLSLSGYDVLTEIKDEPARSQLILCRQLGLDKSKMVNILDQLQDSGFISRIADPDDRRARIIKITPAGRLVHRKVAAELAEIEETLLAELGAKRAGVLRQGLSDLVNGALERLREGQLQPDC
ncbi:MarR family winged helix-turn-helix transcriptional regulator [Kutzneria sp. NPDC052558]|uniref:MarR family winged helix-turn-helix transcriptional regulator n=1 Tax=Kutzneria sp. NPDC052558 TaxID=3364121 RepID=UPI0037C8D0E2